MINIGAAEDKADDFIRKNFFKGSTYKEICLFLEINHECFVSITTLKSQATWFAQVNVML